MLSLKQNVAFDKKNLTSQVSIEDLSSVVISSKY